VIAMRREHIIDSWWLLPGEEIPALKWPGTKNKANHRVWIPQAASGLIGTGNKGPVLAGPKGGGIGNLDAVMRDICLASMKQPRKLRSGFR
jgi:hypothetical protein